MFHRTTRLHVPLLSDNRSIHGHDITSDTTTLMSDVCKVNQDFTGL